MINHARTLLLNRPGKNYAPGTLGEEYTQTNYASLNLPSYLILPHRILFGTDPDKIFLNFRAWELLSLIHATELAEFVYALDPRVTYWPQEQTEFFVSAGAQLSLKKINGYARARAYVQGQVSANSSLGRAYSEYFIRVAQNDDAFTASISANSSAEEIVAPIEFIGEGAGALSQPVALHDAALQIQFSDLVPDAYQFLLLEPAAKKLLTQDYDILKLESGEILSFSFEPPQKLITAPGNIVAQWNLQAYARPADAIKICLPKLEKLGEPLFLELFGVRNDIEPYATFKNIWFDHPMANYRLAAFVLAMIYRANEIRGGKNG